VKNPFKKSDRPVAKSPDDQMTLFQHLAELRTRIIRSVLAVVLGIIIILAAYDSVLSFLLHPYRQLCAAKPNFCELSNGNVISTGPLEGFTTRLSIATYGGILIALPVLMWQIWRFVVPAMHAKERKYAVPFVLSSVLLFLLGGYVAYWTFEPALDWLISWAGQDVQSVFKVSEYVQLLVLMIAVFGLSFEFPVLLVFLQIVGVLTPQTLFKNWRYAIVIIFVIVAIITPSGDPYSMLVLAVPMSVFYLVAALVGLVIQRRKNSKAAAA